tara:strand:+ start:2161 stop:2334 length:174 start_codon:yes stop_codon:yes gene_type:complete
LIEDNMSRKGILPGLSPFKNTDETESTQQEKPKSLGDRVTSFLGGGKRVPCQTNPIG